MKIPVYKHETRPGYYNRAHLGNGPVRRGNKTLCGISTDSGNWEELPLNTIIDCQRCKRKSVGLIGG